MDKFTSKQPGGRHVGFSLSRALHLNVNSKRDKIMNVKILDKRMKFLEISIIQARNDLLLLQTSQQLLHT